MLRTPKKEVPDYYIYQVQFLMHILRLKDCDFIQYIPETFLTQETFIITRVNSLLLVQQAPETQVVLGRGETRPKTERQSPARTAIPGDPAQETTQADETQEGGSGIQRPLANKGKHVQRQYRLVHPRGQKGPCGTDPAREQCLGRHPHGYGQKPKVRLRRRISECFFFFFCEKKKEKRKTICESFQSNKFLHVPKWFRIDFLACFAMLSKLFPSSLAIIERNQKSA